MKTQFMILSMVMLVALLASCTTVEITPEPGQQVPVIVTQDPVVHQGSYVEQSAFVPEQELAIKSFSNEEELLALLDGGSYGGAYYGGVMMRGGGDMMESAVAMDTVNSPAPMVDAGSNSGKIAGLDYSETNNQVLGVDEGDIIKTDGNYIYTITGNTLFIIKAYPGEDAQVVDTLELKKGTPNGLFINGDTLTVFGQVSNYDLFDKWGITTSRGMSYFDIYDISDRTDAELVKEFSFEGSYVASRMIENDVYYVLRSYPQVYARPLLPYIVEDGVSRNVALSSVRYFDMPYDSAQFVSVHAINLDQLDVETETITVESAQDVYMSENNMFIVYTKYINEWQIQQDVTVDMVMDMLSASDKALIKKIKGTDNEVLNQYEKKNKIYEIISRYVEFLPPKEQEDLQDDVEAEVKKELEKYDYFEYTIINKIEVNGQDIKYVASGEVPGHVTNQFSMDEYDNVFRIATTVSQRWSYFMGSNDMSKSTNHVFTLDENLNVMDSLDDLAEGESIYSTRFMGERLYMVTFRQVDPFFVIDLSNPNKIESLGELKIPGFSRYLHPYDSNTIIGIGRDASDTGREQGLKISLFDVRDVENPTEVAQWVADSRYAYTSAEYEHKAFLFDKEKHLLVIPAYNPDYYWNSYADESYNGALVFDIDRNDIELRGLIDHSMSENNRWGPLVERSLFIEDLLYTKSPGLLRINDLGDLSSVKNIELKASRVSGMPVY